MARPETRDLSAVLLLAGLVSLASACRSEGEAGRAARASVACAKACELGLRVTQEPVQADCRSDCVARVVGTNHHCASLVLGWLDCLLADPPTVGATGRERGAVLGVGAQRCPLERQLVERCEEGCRSEGLRSSGEATIAIPEGTVATKYELTDCGCRPCRAARGAEALAPCQAAKVCAEYLFACDGGVTQKLLRSCVEAHCADGKTAAALLSHLLPGQRCLPVTP